MKNKQKNFQNVIKLHNENFYVIQLLTNILRVMIFLHKILILVALWHKQLYVNIITFRCKRHYMLTIEHGIVYELIKWYFNIMSLNYRNKVKCECLL